MNAVNRLIEDAARMITPACSLTCAIMLLLPAWSAAQEFPAPDSLHRVRYHQNGSLQRARLRHETSIADLPARGWIWLYPDGAIDNLELARDANIQGRQQDRYVVSRAWFDSVLLPHA